MHQSHILTFFDFDLIGFTSPNKQCLPKLTAGRPVSKDKTLENAGKIQKNVCGRK